MGQPATETAAARRLLALSEEEPLADGAGCRRSCRRRPGAQEAAAAQPGRARLWLPMLLIQLLPLLVPLAAARATVTAAASFIPPLSSVHHRQPQQQQQTPEPFRCFATASSSSSSTPGAWAGAAGALSPSILRRDLVESDPYEGPLQDLVEAGVLTVSLGARGPGRLR